MLAAARQLLGGRPSCCLQLARCSAAAGEAVRHLHASRAQWQSEAANSAASKDGEGSSTVSKWQLKRMEFVKKRKQQMGAWQKKRDSTPELRARHEFRKEIHALGQRGGWQEILARLDAVRVSGDPPMDIGVYHRSITALAKCDRFEEGTQLLVEMKGKGFQPTAKLFNAVIGAASRVGAWARASQELATMRNWGVKPDLHSYNLTIRAMARMGHWHKALTLSDEMQERHYIRPDVAHFTYLIHGFGKADKAKRAIRLFADMQKRGFQPTVKTYAAAIYAVARNGEADKAAEFMQAMKDAGVQPDVLSHLALAAALDNAGKTDAARQVLEDMKQAGLEPAKLSAEVAARAVDVMDLHAHSLVIQAYAISARHDDMLAYIETLFAQDGPRPDAHTYQMVLDSCTRGAAGEDVLAAVRDSMARHGVAPIPFEKYS